MGGEGGSAQIPRPSSAEGSWVGSRIFSRNKGGKFIELYGDTLPSEVDDIAGVPIIFAIFAGRGQNYHVVAECRKNCAPW